MDDELRVDLEAEATYALVQVKARSLDRTVNKPLKRFIGTRRRTGDPALVSSHAVAVVSNKGPASSHTIRVVFGMGEFGKVWVMRRTEEAVVVGELGWTN